MLLIVFDHILKGLILLTTLTSAQNLAKNRPVTVSSNAAGSSFAVDGDYTDDSGNGGTCWHSLSEVDPWLNVELAEVTHVRTIAFMNDMVTAAVSGGRISGATLHVGNSTTVTDNPSCEVTVVKGGYYECD